MKIYAGKSFITILLLVLKYVAISINDILVVTHNVSTVCVMLEIWIQDYFYELMRR